MPIGEITPTPVRATRLRIAVLAWGAP